MSEQIKVGDKVMRKSGKKTIGVIKRIYQPTPFGKPYGEMRADVLWLGANRRRLGATTPDKRGNLLLSALKLAPQGAEL